MSRPGVLLDRDGTINVDFRYVGTMERFQFIEGAPEAIAKFNKAGIPVAIVTNQSGVARGYYKHSDFYKVMEYMAQELAKHGAHIDYVAHSPHHPEAVLDEYRADSPLHKPNPGMALDAAKELDLNLQESWVVGDRIEDVELASNIGASCIKLGDPVPGSMAHSFPSLATAADFIIEQITGKPATASFPSNHFPDPSHYFDAYRVEQTKASRSVNPEAFKAAALAILNAYRTVGARVFVCGNGGAASVANHFQCDHTKGISQDTELLPDVISLIQNTETITAIANDIGYDSIFAYQLQFAAKPGDILMAFSVSGNSMNVLQALAWAKANGLRTIAMTGFDGGHAGKMADIEIHVTSYNYGVVEDVFQSVMHALAQFIRQKQMLPAAIRSGQF